MVFTLDTMARYSPNLVLTSGQTVCTMDSMVLYSRNLVSASGRMVCTVDMTLLHTLKLVLTSGGMVYVVDLRLLDKLPTHSKSTGTRPAKQKLRLCKSEWSVRFRIPNISILERSTKTWLTLTLNTSKGCWAW